MTQELKEWLEMSKESREYAEFEIAPGAILCLPWEEQEESRFLPINVVIDMEVDRLEDLHVEVDGDELVADLEGVFREWSGREFRLDTYVTTSNNYHGSVPNPLYDG
ncbi:MAG: hypothetical protein ABEH81_01535 [Halopenitus sp.]